MIEFFFVNIEPSQIARDILSDRVVPIIEKFSDLGIYKVILTVEMKNIPAQTGPDLFTVSSSVLCKKFKTLAVKKSSVNFYLAAAAMAEGLNELIDREQNNHEIKK